MLNSHLVVNTARTPFRYLWLAVWALLSFAVSADTSQKQINSPQPVTAQTQWQIQNTQGTPAARHENGFVAVAGRLFLLGGRGERPLDIFDPATGQWQQGAKPPFELHHMQAVAYDDKLYVLGALTGGFPEEKSIANILIYNPATDTWETGPEIPAQRKRGGSGVVVHNGLIYLIGGNNRGHMSGFVAWLDVFNPATGQWTALADAPHARDHFHAVVIDDQIYAAAGRMSSHDTGETMSLTVSAVDVYDIKTQRWHTLDTPLPTPRAGTAAVVINGQLVVIGGESLRQVSAHNEVEAYNPATKQWQTWPALPTGRHGTQATLLNGVVYIAAGSANRGGGPELNDLLLLPLAADTTP